MEPASDPDSPKIIKELTEHARELGLECTIVRRDSWLVVYVSGREAFRSQIMEQIITYIGRLARCNVHHA